MFANSAFKFPVRILAAGVAFVLLLSSAGLAWAEESEGIQSIQKLAEQGNAAAQELLGEAYKNGAGVSQDYAEAIKWFRQAADQGLAVAQYNLGSMYAKGIGIERDNTEAIKWHTLAAKQGHSGAQFYLGVAYHEGIGVPKNDAEAAKWFRLAAERNTQICSIVNNAKVVSEDGKYLGKISSPFSLDSIYNKFGSYGNKFALDSIWNQFGSHGSEFSSHSPWNKFTSTPPMIIKNGEVIGFFTINKFKAGAVNPIIIGITCFGESRGNPN